MKRMMVAISLFLMACGSERKPTDFTKIKDNEQAPGAPCAASYSPLPLLRSGAVPLASPDLVLAGSYSVESAEVYLRSESEDGVFQAHFLEEKRLGGISQRKICSTVLPAGTFVEASFPAVMLYSRVNPAKEGEAVVRKFTPGAFFLQAEEKRVNLSKVANGQEQAGGFSPVLQQWNDWRLYQTASGVFEVRAHASDVSSGARHTRRMVLRLSALE